MNNDEMLKVLGGIRIKVGGDKTVFSDRDWKALTRALAALQTLPHILEMNGVSYIGMAAGRGVRIKGHEGWIIAETNIDAILKAHDILNEEGKSGE